MMKKGSFRPKRFWPIFSVSHQTPNPPPTNVAVPLQSLDPNRLGDNFLYPPNIARKNTATSQMTTLSLSPSSVGNMSDEHTAAEAFDSMVTCATDDTYSVHRLEASGIRESCSGNHLAVPGTAASGSHLLKRQHYPEPLDIHFIQNPTSSDIPSLVVVCST